MNKAIYRDRVVAFLKNRNFHAICILELFFGYFLSGCSFLWPNVSGGNSGSWDNASSKPGPLSEPRIEPGFVATDLGANAWDMEPV